MSRLMNSSSCGTATLDGAGPFSDGKDEKRANRGAIAGEADRATDAGPVLGAGELVGLAYACAVSGQDRAPTSRLSRDEKAPSCPCWFTSGEAGVLPSPVSGIFCVPRWGSVVGSSGSSSCVVERDCRSGDPGSLEMAMELWRRDVGVVGEFGFEDEAAGAWTCSSNFLGILDRGGLGGGLLLSAG